MGSVRLAEANAKALAKRPFLQPGWEFRPASTSDETFHTFKSQHPYYGYVDVEVEGVPPFLMFSNNDDRVAQVYFWYGPDAFESLSLRVWRELARRSNRIFDIGAFTGLYAIAAGLVNRTAEIYCFEPTKQSFGRLTANLRVNGLARRVEAFDVALSDADGYATVASSRNYLTLDSGASLVPKGDKEILRRERVATARLDTFVHEHEIPAVDLAKIDVERAEKLVIGGMTGVLERHQPHLLVEVFSENDLRDLYGTLAPYGYSFAVIGDATQVAHVNDFGANEEGSNILFSPESPADLRTFCNTLQPLRSRWGRGRTDTARYYSTDYRALETRLHEANKQERRARRTLEEMQNSRSWRIVRGVDAATAPIRRIAERIKRKVSSA